MAILSLNQPITVITAIKALHDGHPVFLLVADDDSHLVVKQEETTDTANLRRNQLTMQLASRESRSVILTPTEVDALKGYIRSQKFIAKWGGPVLSADDLAFNKYLNGTGTWFKMKEAQGLVNLASAAKQLLDGDKSGVRALAKSLNSTGGLEALGKIVAADMFNQNGDRFAPKNGANVYVKNSADVETEFKVKTLVNVGNVMAAVSGSKLKVIGLDSWDPNAEVMADMNNAPPRNGWMGDLLAPDKATDRLEFATDIRDDLNLLLGPRNRRFEFLQQTRLNPDAALRIVKGMDRMRSLLIDKMKQSLKRPSPPAGLAERLRRLRGH